MMPWAFVFAADIVVGLLARVKKERRKEMVGDGGVVWLSEGRRGGNGVTL